MTSAVARNHKATLDLDQS